LPAAAKQQIPRATIPRFEMTTFEDFSNCTTTEVRSLTPDAAFQRYNRLMRRLILLLAACLFVAVPGSGQSQGGEKDANQNHPPPRSDSSKGAGESSSRDSQIDLSPPDNDTKEHPNSTLPQDEVDDNTAGDVQEFRAFDPHRASKDIEVGDFYFKKRNYRAALERYREALLYKPSDAFANFRMAQAFEKLAQPDEAAAHYQEYLKIMPNGPLAEEAKKALEKLKASAPSDKDQAKQ
jgi:tetratricopeptide (TPR) repeat protein